MIAAPVVVDAEGVCCLRDNLRALEVLGARGSPSNGTSSTPPGARGTSATGPAMSESRAIARDKERLKPLLSEEHVYVARPTTKKPALLSPVPTGTTLRYLPAAGNGAGASARKPTLQEKPAGVARAGASPEPCARSPAVPARAPEVPARGPNLAEAGASIPDDSAQDVRAPDDSAPEVPAPKNSSAEAAAGGPAEQPQGAAPRRSFVSATSPSALLAMRFIRKPLRASEELSKASDPTQRNLAINAGRADPSDDVLLPSSPAPVHELVRKKLGQVLRLLMKEHPQPRARSLPLTPTYKQVHFGGGPDVKYFSQRDRPAAILALNSPATSDTEDGDDLWDEQASDFQLGDASAETRAPGIWSVEVLNLPGWSYHERTEVRKLPVFLENMFVLSDQRFLVGQVAVRNVAYHKAVAVRYTPDKWATIVETAAVYVPDAPAALRKHDYDRFVFKLDLARFAHASMPVVHHMCVRYSVPGAVYWDNNGGTDYAVRLARTGPARPAVPSGARSPGPAQRTRPRYSLAFLKRVNSDPVIADPPATLPFLRFRNSFRNNFLDLDFDRNDCYLSSPLLTSLRTDALDVPRFKHGRRKRVDEPVSPTSEPPSPAVDTAAPAGRLLPVPADLHALPDNRIGTMSYKELLESYCFFSAPAPDAAVLPPLLQTTDPEAAFTVSSFLRGL